MPKEPVLPPAGEPGELLPLALEAAEEGERLEGLDFSGQTALGEDLAELELSGCRLGRSRMTGSPSDAASLRDVLFQDCDLSQCRFTKASLTRCAFDGCKALGADLSGASLRDVSFSNCRLDLANCNAAALRDVAFRDCSMEDAALSGCRVRGLTLDRCALTRVNFFQTPLAGVDLTSCTLIEPVFSASAAELKGAVVDLFQAAQLARRFGIVIKE